MDRIHPRYTEAGKLKKFSCCKAMCFHTGSNCLWCVEKETNDFDNFGPAVVLYFRHLKTTIWFTFLCAIINAFLVYLYSASYNLVTPGQAPTDAGQANILLTAQQWSLAASLGGYATSSTLFFEANFTNISTLNSTYNSLTSNTSNPNQINLKCDAGVIDTSPQYTFYGLADKRFPATYTFYMFVKDANVADNFYKALSAGNCHNKTNCTVTYNENWFNSNGASYVNGSVDGITYKLYLKYHCYQISMNLYGNVVTKSDLNKLIIILNGLILLLYLFYLSNWEKYEKGIFKFFALNHPLPSDYTIKLSNLPQGMSENQLKSELFLHFNNFRNSLKIAPDFIVDINVAQSNNTLYLNKRVNHYENKVGAIIEQLITNKVLPISDQTTAVPVNFVIDYWQKNKKSLNSGVPKQLFKKFFSNVKKKQGVEEYINKLRSEKSEFKSVFVTFNRNVNKVKIYNEMNKTKTKRCCIGCSKKKDLNNFKGKVLRASKPVEPVNIMWNNLQITSLEKFLRRFVSWIFTILFVVTPIVVVILMSYAMRDSENLKLSCTNPSAFSASAVAKDPTIKVKVIQDYMQGSNSQNLLYCYCSSAFSSRLYE